MALRISSSSCSVSHDGVVSSMTMYNRKHYGCKIEGCKDIHEGLGYCKKHYLKLYKHGDPLAMPHKGRSKSGKLIKCLVCGMEKYYIRSLIRGRKHFCSLKCYGVSLRGKNRPQWVVEKLRGRIREKSASWKGGKTVSPEGYVLINTPEHPSAKTNNYVFEHRLTMEKKLGRYLKSEEHIHHINFKKDDNRISNLMVMSNADHKRLHCRNANANS